MKKILLLCSIVFSSTSDGANLWDSRQLLLDKQYDILESQIFDADQALLNNQPNAVHLYHFTHSSMWKPRDFLQNDILDSLNAWRMAKPNSFAPSAALGKYYSQYGYFLRGNKFIDSTSIEQIQQMKIQHQKAKLFFLDSIKKNNTSISSYLGLIDLDKTTSIFEKTNWFKQRQATENFICSSKFFIIYNRFFSCEPNPIHLSKTKIFSNAPKKVLKVSLIWRTFIHNYLPRWGGGYSTMESVAHEAQNFLSEEKMLPLSEVSVTDKMDTLILQKKFSEAEKLGLKFLTKKSKANIYNHKENSTRTYAALARTSMKAGKYQNCIKYSEVASRLYFWNPKIWENYGYCAMKLKSYELANFAFRYQVDTSNKLDAWSAYFLGESYMRIKKYKLAFLLMSKSIEMDPSYSQYAEVYLKWLKDNEPKSIVQEEIIHSEIVGKLSYDGILLN